MRIVHIIWGLETGGAETMLVDIINEQVKSNDVSLFIINDLVNQSLLQRTNSRCEIRQFYRKIGSKSFWPWLKVNINLWKFHPDIIHLHLEGMRKMIFCPVPKVFTIHNMHTSGVEYSKYNSLYAISDAVKRKTKEQGYESTTIWNGIHPEMIHVKATKSRCPKDECRFVCIGRLYSPHKGQDVLINALAKLKENGVVNYHLDFIGDGESRDELEKLASDLDLKKNVTFLGKKDRNYVYSHLRDYDLFILPSISEGFGLTVAEAMCAKTPVLICDLPGPMEVIDNGNLGMSFTAGNPIDLAEKLFDFIKFGANDKLTEEAYRFAIKNFDVKTTANRYCSEYEKILTKQK